MLSRKLNVLRGKHETLVFTSVGDGQLHEGHKAACLQRRAGDGFQPRLTPDVRLIRLERSREAWS